MRIKNWNKLVGERVTILGSEFIISEVEDISTNYKASFFDAYSLKKTFDILLYKKDGWFDLKCEFDINSLAIIHNQAIRAVLRKNDVITINSFINTIVRVFTKNNIIYSYFQLIGEAQKINKNKNKLKISNGGGTYGIPTGSLISKI